jgi:SEL1 protein
MRGGHRGEEEVDEFGETMILVALCLMVSVLLYVRTRLVERMRREHEAPAPGNDDGQQQQQGQPQGQAIPPAGDAVRDGVWGAIL